MAYVRVLHASPGTSDVDVYANGRRISSNLSYQRHTDYHRIPAGTHEIALYRAGRRFRPIISTRIVISRGGVYTIAASGQPNRIILLPVQEQWPGMASGQAYVKFVHLSPNAPNVDVTLPDGTVLFGNIGYNVRTGYIAVNPGTYSFQVRLAGTNQVLLTVPSATLAPGNVYTVYAMGMMDGSSNPLHGVITQDGSSNLVMDDM